MTHNLFWTNKLFTKTQQNTHKKTTKQHRNSCQSQKSKPGRLAPQSDAFPYTTAITECIDVSQDCNCFNLMSKHKKTMSNLSFSTTSFVMYYIRFLTWHCIDKFIWQFLIITGVGFTA